MGEGGSGSLKGCVSKFLPALLVWGFLFAHGIAAPGDTPVVLALSSTPRVELRAGDSAVVRIPLRIAKGFHVNANPPSTDDYYPLEILVADTLGITFGKPVYPKGKVFRLAGTDEDLLVYDGNVDIRVPVKLASDVKPTKLRISGEISFQACDHEACWFPDVLPLAIEITVKAR